jgi:putative transposase
VRFRFIREHRGTFDVGRMCAVLEVSRSGFYAWLKRLPSVRSRENGALLDQIKAIHAKSRGRYGSPRIHQELLARGVRCSLGRVERLMRDAGIQARRRRPFRVTTNSAHSKPVAPNLLNQNFSVDAPNRVWVGDITYIPTGEGWLFLAAILDLFSRAVVGWSMSSRIDTALVLAALRMAIGRRGPAPGLIFHSDRGSQYASGDYQAELSKHQIVCSMSGKGNCYDNAVMESFFGTTKTEHVHLENFATRAVAMGSIFEYIEVFYNRRRRHSSIGYMTPTEFEAVAAANDQLVKIG